VHAYAYATGLGRVEEPLKPTTPPTTPSKNVDEGVEKKADLHSHAHTQDDDDDVNASNEHAQTKNEAYFLVVECPVYQEWRSSLGLPAKDLHITLGFTRTDIHNQYKGPSSIMRAL
jgi:hypothetical protein